MYVQDFNDQISRRFATDFHTVVPFNPRKDSIAALDLSPANTAFTEEIYKSEQNFDAFIKEQFTKTGARYLVGGYAETRNMYLRSKLFDNNLSQDSSLVVEPRNLHLGADIWGEAGTNVHMPVGGMVHSLANNNNFGDYGPTIIMQHQIDMYNFYTLYGHLSLADLSRPRIGQFIARGEVLGHFGKYEENGSWPPHLHFQIIIEINEWVGDYPGVCKAAEAPKFLANSPDPDYILQLNKFIK